MIVGGLMFHLLAGAHHGRGDGYGWLSREFYRRWWSGWPSSAPAG